MAKSFELLQAFAIWLAAVTVGLGYYAVVTGSVILFLRLFWDKGLARRKIQKREASAADIQREIPASLSAMMVFSLITVLVNFGVEAKVFSVSLRFSLIGVPYLIASTAAMVVGLDAYFYWSHRLLHHRHLFGRFHRTHHKSVAPTAFAAIAFDPVESALYGSFVLLWLLIVPMHLVGILIFVGIALTRTAIGHCGVELFPLRNVGDSCSGWIINNTHHNVHHTKINYNFGLFFTFWDRIMGTEYRGDRAQWRQTELAGSSSARPFR
jgi:lathosterol oxidase